MPSHLFIFSPGLWIGEGRISFALSPDILRFYTKWQIEAKKNGGIETQQQVEMEGRSENLFNRFAFSHLTTSDFKIKLISDLLGQIEGTGVIDAKTIAWEFRGHPDFEGFEVYELQENGDYMLHAEYSSAQQFRTIIDGRIWKKG